MQWNVASCCEFDGKSMEAKTTTWSEFPNGGKAIAEQILASQEINKSKRTGLREPQPQACLNWSNNKVRFSLNNPIGKDEV